MDTRTMTVPYLGPLKTPLIPGGSIKVTGTVLAHAKSFIINLLCGPVTYPKDDIVLHFYPDFIMNTIGVNTLIQNVWGPEEVLKGFPFAKGSRYDIVFICEDDFFKVIVNGQILGNYEHRIPPRRITHIEIDGDVTLFDVNTSNSSQSSYGFNLSGTTGNTGPGFNPPSSAPPYPTGGFPPAPPPYPTNSTSPLYPTQGNSGFTSSYQTDPGYNTGKYSQNVYPPQSTYPMPPSYSDQPLYPQPSSYPQNTYKPPQSSEFPSGNFQQQSFPPAYQNPNNYPQPPSYPTQPPSYPTQPPSYPTQPPSYPAQPPSYPYRPPGPYASAPTNQFQGGSPKHKTGILEKAGMAVAGTLAGGGLMGAMMHGKKGLKSHKKAQKKALKYGLPIAGVGLGAYALKKGFRRGSSSSSSSSD